MYFCVYSNYILNADSTKNSLLHRYFLVFFVDRDHNFNFYFVFTRIGFFSSSFHYKPIHLLTLRANREILLPPPAEPLCPDRTHTLHRDTRDFRSSPLLEESVSDCGMSNCRVGSMVESQKLNLSAKKWHVPRAPWHSINGFGLNSSRHEPADESDCPAPVLPAAAT